MCLHGAVPNWARGRLLHLFSCYSDLLLRHLVNIFNKQAVRVVSRNMARHIDKSHTSSVDVTCINAVKEVWGLICFTI